MKQDEAIERRIITGLIVSTEYTQQIRQYWKPGLLQSKTARMLAIWCIEYFDKYTRAPGKDIEGIYTQKLRDKNITDEQGEDIEDILDDLSDEYERSDKFNVDYLLDQTNTYFDEQNLKEFTTEIQSHIDRGDLSEAKKKAGEYTPISSGIKKIGIDFSNEEELLSHIEKAFTYSQQPVVKYPRQMGQFLNDILVRDSLVGIMGSEKRGKTFWLLEFAIRAARQRANVAFFEAGDMSEDQIIRRISIYLAKQSDKEKYSGKMYQPTRDCIWNQIDSCDLTEREGDHGIFSVRNDDEKKNIINHIRRGITIDELKEKYEEFPDYKPCYNCLKYWKSKWGATWIKHIDAGPPLKFPKAQKAAKEFFIKQNRRFKLACYPSGTLTVKEMKTVLDIWERQDKFIPDMIVVDYPDIMASEIQGVPRDQENDKWAKLRGLSQARHCLILVGTQADAASYKKNWLHLDNFSEDKRKYGHVSAMIGLNQDPDGREKGLKQMRLNKLVVREEDFINSEGIVVLQNLSRGQPYLSSFFT
jgi:hypothetical protein